MRDRIAFLQKLVFYCLMIATCDGHFMDTMQFCFRHVLDNLCIQATLFQNIIGHIKTLEIRSIKHIRLYKRYIE